MPVSKIISALVLITVVTGVLYLPAISFLIFLLAVVAAAQWELLSMTGTEGALRAGIAALGCMLVLCMTVPASDADIVLCGAMIMFSSILILTRTSVLQQNALRDLSAAAFTWIYVAIPLGVTARMWFGEHGFQRVLFLLMATTVRNISAGMIGRLVRGHAISWASPRKTYQGAAIGLVVTTGVVMLSRPFAFPSISWRDAVILSLVIGVLGQLGDLAESMLKRQFGCVDSGGMFPGQGGILDTIDSFLFTGPAVYCFFRFGGRVVSIWQTSTE